VPATSIPAAGAQAGLGSVSGATTTLEGLLQYPGMGEQAGASITPTPGALGYGNTPLPTGAGPTSAPAGPVIQTGSANPLAYGPNVGTSPGPIPSLIPFASALRGSRNVSPIVAGVFSALGLNPASTTSSAGAFSSGSASLPSYQTGTASVPATGPAILHAGEAVLPVGAAATAQAQSTLNSAKVNAEQQTSSIASTRIGMEMKLLQMKQQQNQNDLQVLNAYQQIMAAISSGNFNGLGNAINILGGNRQGPGAIHLEDSMYQLYSERGRYGEGTVAGSYP
jgi:hypothetical protein